MYNCTPGITAWFIVIIIQSDQSINREKLVELLVQDIKTWADFNDKMKF